MAEALPKDVGRGVVRLDPVDIELLGAKIGDIVQLAGKGQAVARILPADASERGQRLAQMDGILRENAQVSLGEIVQVGAISQAHPARRVTLTPVAGGAMTPVLDPHYIRRLIEGIPLLVGNRVRVTLFGARPLEFTVTEAVPNEVVIVSPFTMIHLGKNARAEQSGVPMAYEDIGGLGKELAQIREMIEIPLRYPEIFERLGIAPPQGVLLHGPPGCGKTLIARAVAHETAAYFLSVACPEIYYKFYGESEAHLRSIFEDAEKHAPSIIFLDEIDVLAPKRENVQGEVEKRVVAQLLTLMDGLQARGRIMVIGATNIPGSLDPALRRPGRFDREISISVPDRVGRREILDIHTRGMPLATDVDMERLAGMTHGFVGADLAALAREAAMSCVRQALPVMALNHQVLAAEELQFLEVKMDHFLDALRDIEPSAIREVFTEIPEVTWEHVGGLREVKQLLRETIEWPLIYADRFVYSRTVPPRGILLMGSPGTGKTLVAKAVASESGVNFIAISGPTLLSKWVGESEKGIRDVFRKARQAAPCILFFDEIDALLPTRGNSESGSQVAERIVGQFLTEMDGIESLRGVMVLGATNRPDKLDPALLRPGRFEIQVTFPIPDMATRLEILQIHLRGRPLAQSVDLASLAERTQGLTGAHLEGICHRAALLAIRESVEQEPDSTYTPFTIETRHMDTALALIIAPPVPEV